MRRLVTWQLAFVLSVKCGVLGMGLKAAREQTADAEKQGLPLDRFKEREQVMIDAIARNVARIRKLRGEL